MFSLLSYVENGMLFGWLHEIAAQESINVRKNERMVLEQNQQEMISNSNHDKLVLPYQGNK